MISHRSLVPILLALFASKGLSADSLEPWRAWVTFKEFARRVDEVPDPGVSVQIRPGRHGDVDLFFLRQAIVETDEWNLPVGGVVCQLTFSGRPSARTGEYWSFDYHDFERFVDVVESDSDFVALLLETPNHTAVYWENSNVELR
jgi:hypothetical protein